MFVDATADSGLTFLGESWGASWGDFNQDGWVDLYTSNHRDPATLYLNNQDGSFTDVTERLIDIPSDPDPHAATWADFDGDGDLDLLQAGGGGTGVGRGVDTAFYINEDGVFVDRAESLGLSLVQLRGRTPIFFDFNNDGRLDILITGIARLDGNDVPSPVYLQNEAGQFEEITELAELSVPNFQFGILSDLSGDGRLDLIIEKPFRVYDVSALPWVEIQDSLFDDSPPFFGDDYASADFNGDGRLDLFVRNPTDKLYISTETGFIEQGESSGLVRTGTLGDVVAFDYDNDMDVDLYVLTASTDYRNILYENQGDGTFVIREGAAGAERTTLGFADTVTTADVNNDGFLDLYLTNGKGAPERYIVDGQLPPNQLFINQGNDNHWLEVYLDGIYSNPDGIGATIFATAGDITQIREQNNGIHHRAQNHALIHFGLGEYSTVQSLEIQWTSGIQQVLGEIEADQIIRVKEGIGDRGDDVLTGTALNESLQGKQGDDFLQGNEGHDTLRGNAGNDTLLGGSGQDLLIGGTKNDVLNGGDGNDKLTGQQGIDTMTGGAGKDNFQFSRLRNSADIITDFNPGEDRLSIRNVGFGGTLSRGRLASEQFVLGLSALDASDRFIYDVDTGNLYFDQDGNGSQSQQLLATLTNQASLAANHIRVF